MKMNDNVDKYVDDQKVEQISINIKVREEIIIRVIHYLKNIICYYI